MAHHYTFGDNDRAADRLSLLARVFEPSSAALLESVRPATSSLAVDLGCGPGYTTELLHRTVRAARTWGLDASERLVERARSWLPVDVTVAAHDVTKSPYPVASVDVAYARYVLTHLASPRALVDACALAMKRGGLLVLEENCALGSEDPTFSDYYTRVAKLQSHYGQDMYIGSRLPALATTEDWHVESFVQSTLVLDSRAMAQLHALNAAHWRGDPFAVSAFDTRELDVMAHDLRSVAMGERPAPPVICVMGQLVLRRK